MTLVLARIQPQRPQPVQEAHVNIGVTKRTATAVKAFGEGASQAKIHRGLSTSRLHAMVNIEALVEAGLVDHVVSAIRQASAATPEQRPRVWADEARSEVSQKDDSA